MVQEFIPGQRWISDSELQMGLGTVLGVEHRTVTILFLATGETRIYAKQTAPLTRVRFTPGNRVKTHEGWSFRIETLEEHNGLITYKGTKDDGQPAVVEEGQLDNFIQINRPADRLLTGQIDQDKWFNLRYETRRYIDHLSHSDLRGITGVRTSLIPHQLYIAHEVANRYAPRVLLADEVGLGKTIEAGLIVHQQLLTERAGRVLIVVPESLLHQWLVEMLRRFNLHFSIFDESRCALIDEGNKDEFGELAAGENPFSTEQLVLCSLEFLVHNRQRYEQALTGEWDLLVVDEAHHLQWSPQQSSSEYELVENLAKLTKGVLLLTATPEQLGKASHFARLRLLDPDRFPDFDAFVEEERHYQPIAHVVHELLTEKEIDAEGLTMLSDTVAEGDNQRHLQTLTKPSASADEQANARQALVDHLLDRHGTGRVLFRNTRAAVKGFPQRTVSGYPLDLPAAYADSLSSMQDQDVSETRLLLCPELVYQAGTADAAEWTVIDPRVEWLIKKLKELKPQKVLVITASAESALDLEQMLRVKSGIHAAVFHEGLSLVERDRAAAYFADREYGSQVLICSEIGSEGRNFQFAHHLILFDLPLNPDLLEQRIGRLDRIGQTETIKIHVPYLAPSAQAIMFQWYHHGLNAFEQTCPAGHSVFVELREKLLKLLHETNPADDKLSELVEETRKLHQGLNEALHQGRDQLLEYNSCRPHIANALRERTMTQDKTTTLPDYLVNVFDCFDVETEEHSAGSQIIRPGPHMQNSFPALQEGGMTVTYSREVALSNEDVHYLTWEHPLVTGAMDMIISREQGNTAVTAIKHSAIPPGTIFLECLYLLESASSTELATSRYLPSTTIRVVVDEQGKNYGKALSHELIAKSSHFVDKGIAKRIVQSKLDDIKKMLSHAEQHAQAQAPDILKLAHGQAHASLTEEVNRLIALRTVNPNVREEEIHYFESQLQVLDELLDATLVQLDAVRVIVAT